MTASPASAQPTLGVIILNYNYGNYIPDAIGAVLGQSRAFDQVLVVNDGSTDDSVAVIRGYEPQVRLIDQPNSGQMKASIAGLAEITTDYVYILDADDFPIPGMVERLAPLLARRPVKVQFQVSSVDEKRELLHSVYPLFPEGYDSAAMQADNRSAGFYVAPPTAGNVYLTSFLRGLDLGILAKNDPIDGVPSMIAPYFGEVISLNEPLAHYRVHGNSHSQWGKPTVALLQGEIDWLHRRWAEADRLFDAKPHVGDIDGSLYVAERRLMIAALAGEPTGPAAADFLRILKTTGFSGTMKAGLSVWARAMRLPSKSLRQRLVLARRSPGKRPAVVNMAIAGAKRAAVLAAGASAALRGRNT